MRALVVGLGRMGRFHARVLADLGLDVTTVDPDPSAGADYRAVPATASPHVVCIATPMDTLAERAARWANHPGWLLVEKPGATSHDEARELADLLAGQRVAVGYVERFNPCVRAFKRALGDSAPAKIAKFVRLNDRPSPHIASDLMSHDVDLMWFLGLEDCDRVSLVAGAGGATRERTVRVVTADGGLVGADLTAHAASPLHAQWHAFLAGRDGHATVDDAARVMRCLDGVRAQREGKLGVTLGERGTWARQTSELAACA